MKKIIYLDNGATTRVADEVIETMIPYLNELYGNPSSIYRFSSIVKAAVDKARKTIADLINCSPEEIIFTSGGTESDNLAIRGLAESMKKFPGKNHIITSKIEHPAILRTCEDLENEGFSVTYLDVDKEGFISLDNLKKSITENTFLVSVMHANNEIGTIQDIEAIGKICKDRGIMFHTDAVQSFTKSRIDTKTMNIDLASFAAHKIHGPKGIGALYVRKGVAIKQLQTGGGQERKIRAGTENVPGIIGFGRAVELATHNYIDMMAKLRNEFIDKMLDSVPECFLNGPKQNRLCNNINIGFRYIEGEGILMHLDEDNICVSTGSACSSKSLEPSHVLKAIGLAPEESHGCIRFTISRYTTHEELEFTLLKIQEIVNKLRKISPLTPKNENKEE